MKYLLFIVVMSLCHGPSLLLLLSFLFMYVFLSLPTTYVPISAHEHEIIFSGSYTLPFPRSQQSVVLLAFLCIINFRNDISYL